MSRSWERKVRKNMSKINTARKKQGTGQILLNNDKSEKFVGRNFVSPIMLLVFVSFYSVVMQSDSNFKASGMYWVTLGCYVLLAALFFFRRPYLKLGKDYVQSRRFTGDKRLNVSDIKGFRVQNGYVTVIPQKGAGWTFSRLLNRFKTDEMSAKLKIFASTHNLPFEEK